MQKLKIDLKNDDNFLSIVNILKPYTKRAYFVGGCVRNALLGLPCDDYDIEIYDIEPKIFDELMQKLGANGVGKSFFVYKYKKFDLALARYENKISTGHRGFEVKVCNDEQEGAKRRDFTINALMVNIFDFKFLDFFNGLQDLQAKIIRHIDDKSFVEDSLRVLRGISFACRFDLTIARESLKLMQTMDISDLSKERINNELYKIFKTSRLNKAYEYFKILNLEEKIFFYQSHNKEFERLLEHSQKLICDEALYLYLYLNFFRINKEEFFKKTKLKKELLKKCEQGFILGKIDDFNLAKIALKIPLCKWLGLWDNERITQAKKINLYYHTFESKISANDLLKEGFNGKELGIELEKRRLQELKNYIKEQKMKEYILKISCSDEKGLIYRISDVIFKYRINIIKNDEFVGENRFFFRAHLEGELDIKAFKGTLEAMLPDNAQIEITPKRKKDIIVLATKETHCLGELLIRQFSGEFNANIKAVIANYDTLKPLVDKFNIPFHAILAKDLSRQEHEEKILQCLKEYEFDYIVLAKYMRILSPFFVEHFEGKIINIHHSFLPAFIGANPYKQAYERGVKIIGATAHFVNNDLDEGPIITQDVIPVTHEYSWQAMQQAGRNVEKNVFSKALDLVFDDRIFIHENKTIVF